MAARRPDDIRVVNVQEAVTEVQSGSGQDTVPARPPQLAPGAGRRIKAVPGVADLALVRRRYPEARDGGNRPWSTRPGELSAPAGTMADMEYRGIHPTALTPADAAEFARMLHDAPGPHL